MQLPRHIVIVMDGNGRWAKKRGLPRTFGHKVGADSVKAVIQRCVKLGIEALTLFAFSTENWGRPQAEIDYLMQEFFAVLNKQMDDLHKNNIKFRVIGEANKLDVQLQGAIQQAEALTVNNKGLKLNIALSYSGRWDIVEAARKLATAVANKELAANEIDVAKFNAATALSDLPEPDLFIRTSGEQRISNFMLWQLAYTELYFTSTLWPDFREAELDAALAEFAKRERRFGKL